VAQRLDMRPGEVGDVDVVPQARTVPRVVILAEHRDLPPLAERGLAGDLDEVGGAGGALAARPAGSAPATLK
jgi:hypothetical protein